MLEYIFAAILFGATVEPEQPAPAAPDAPTAAPVADGQKANESKATAWTMPKLDYSGNGCEQFMQRSLDGFGNLKVGTPCPAKPAEAASKGRSLDKRN